MVGIYWLLIILLLPAFCILLLEELKWIKKRRKSPPGPKGLPIIGSMHLIGKNPQNDFFHLSKKHGPIMYMRFGYVPVIIVSSPKAAEKFLKTHDLSFLSRPYKEASWSTDFGDKNISLAPYGPYWRNMRKLVTLELVSTKKISSFESMRREEVSSLIKSIKTAASDRVSVDLTSLVTSSISGMGCLMIFGKNYMEENVEYKKLKDHIDDLTQLAAVPSFGEYLPLLELFDFRLNSQKKHVMKILDDFLDKVIDDHVESKRDGKTKDFVDTMLGILESGQAEFEFDRRHIKCVLMDVFVGSLDTSSVSIDWAMTELIRHPNVMKKLQLELQEKIGMNRMVQESDLQGLEYLDAVVKETMRLHPPVPLLFPHEAIEDCIVNGYNIERKSRVLVNAWGIGRDPNVWTEPESFIPERFIGSNIDLKGRDFQLIPFSSGRRMCPGIQLGLMVVRLVLAQLVHCFNWELPCGMSPSDMDMSETFGFVAIRAKHLLVDPTYRLDQ